MQRFYRGCLSKRPRSGKTGPLPPGVSSGGNIRLELRSRKAVSAMTPSN
jgi:hypothetical protein